MSAAFGVHFGCTSACLAVYKDGKTDVVANDLGDRVTPCIVAFTDQDQAVGVAAKQGLIRNARNTVCNIKKLVGRRFEEDAVADYTSQSSAKLVNRNGLPVLEVEFRGETKTMDPVHITEAIYRKMLETAESHGGRGIKDAVLTVPVSFNTEQKKAVSEAATKAGFNILRVISEPAAAVLAYDIGQADIHEENNVLVYRVGGVSIDAVVVRVSNGIYQILSTVSDTDHGGDKFTDELVEYLATDFQRLHRNNARENKRSMVKLKMAAETCKHTLSTLNNAQCAIDSLYDGIDFHANVSRARFEDQCSRLIPQCIQPVEEALEKAGLTKDDIHKLILCGGGTKLPLLQKAVGEFLSQAELLNNVPDETIAIGAAKQAAILVGNDAQEVKENGVENEMDCLTCSIAVKVKSSSEEERTELQPIFSKGLPIPARKHQTFTLSGEQNSFCLEMFESLTGELESSRLLAKIVMKTLSSGAVIKATFHFRREGSLHVTCSEPMSGQEESITIEME